MNRKQSDGTTGKICRCRQPSILISCAMHSEKIIAYNCLADLMQEILKEILINHNKQTISVKTIVIQEDAYQYEAYPLHQEPGFCIAWTCNGVVEAYDDTFHKFIEFNEIKAGDKESQLQPCYCDGNRIDFLTLADTVKSILDKAHLLGFAEHMVNSWKEKSENYLQLATLIR